MQQKQLILLLVSTVLVLALSAHTMLDVLRLPVDPTLDHVLSGAMAALMLLVGIKQTS